MTDATTVFLTGADTTVGRITARALIAAGHRVVGAVIDHRQATALRADGVIPAYPDMTRVGEIVSVMQGATIVIHALPLADNHLPHTGSAPDAERLLATTDVLATAAAQTGVTRFISASFAFVDAPVPSANADADAHGHDGGHGAATSVQPDATAIAYARTAKAAESRALGAGMASIVLRFGFLYGAQSPELVLLRDRLRMGRLFSPGRADTHAAWITIDDAAAALIAAVESDVSGRALVVAEPEQASPADFLRYFAEVQGFGIPNAPRFNPLALIGITLGAPSLMGVHYTIAGAETADALGWAPRFSSYRAGIDDLLLTWRGGLQNDAPAATAIVPAGR